MYLCYIPPALINTMENAAAHVAAMGAHYDPIVIVPSKRRVGVMVHMHLYIGNIIQYECQCYKM